MKRDLIRLGNPLHLLQLRTAFAELIFREFL